MRPDGSFEYWRLDPGEYRLRAEWNGADGSHVRSGAVKIAVAESNIDGLELRVLPDLEIAGRLEDRRALISGLAIFPFFIFLLNLIPFLHIDDGLVRRELAVFLKALMPDLAAQTLLDSMPVAIDNTLRQRRGGVRGRPSPVQSRGRGPPGSLPVRRVLRAPRGPARSRQRRRVRR